MLQGVSLLSVCLYFYVLARGKKGLTAQQRIDR